MLKLKQPKHIFSWLIYRQLLSLEVTQFFIAFVQRTEDSDVIHCMSQLLYMMSGDAALSSVIPFDCHDILHRCCEDIRNGIPVDMLLEEVKKY